MDKFIFTDKCYSNEFAAQVSICADFNIRKPRYCPICSTPQEGRREDSKLWALGNGKYYGTVMYTCNSCNKRYLATYDLDVPSKTGKFSSFHPALAVEYENDLLEPVSQKFINAYSQALRAEHAGDIDLAGMGYRKALECLLKDFAITELGVDISAVEKLSVYDVIGKYYDNDIQVSADVVRILGNDYTHYESKHPETDFNVLKRYMDIFVALIETKVLINHPPVSR